MVEKFVVANWKMNGNLQSVSDLLNALTSSDPKITQHANVTICPSFLHASFVLGRLSELGWHLGAQDCAATPNGAYTGDISAEMLQDMSCRHVLIGHSERRQHHLETNITLRNKMQRAFDAHLTPILCIGETAEQYAELATLNVLQQQLEQCLVYDVSRPFMIAYEPIWAIGTGKVASVTEIVSVHQNIKSFLQKINASFNNIPILYGGSVNGDNAQEIMEQPDVDGVLVGGASLKVDAFLNILSASRLHP